MVYRFLSDDDAKTIMELLWAGYSYRAIAIKFNVSPGHIGNIAAGESYWRFPWQDGSIGPLPASRKREIAESRRGVQRARGTAKAAAEPSIVKGINITAIADEAAARMNRSEEFDFSKFQSSKPRRKEAPEPPAAPLQLDPLPWKDVLIVASGHPLVLQAEADGDEDMKRVIGHIFKMIPPSAWDNERVAADIAQLTATLREENKI